MDTKETYQEYRREVGKDAAKTLAFVFIGLPAICLFIAWLIVY